MDTAFTQQPRTRSSKDTRRGWDNIIEPATPTVFRLARPYQVLPDRFSSAPAIGTSRRRHMFEGPHADSLGKQGKQV